MDPPAGAESLACETTVRKRSRRPASSVSGHDTLHRLGLEHDKLTFPHQGRLHRLTGPEGGKVVSDIFS